MWEVLKVGVHLVQRTAFLLAALAMATAAASRVGTDELAGHQIVAQLFLFLAIGVDMFKVAGQSSSVTPSAPTTEVRPVWSWRTSNAGPHVPASCCSWSSWRCRRSCHASSATTPTVLAAATSPCVPGGDAGARGVHVRARRGPHGGDDFRDLRWQTTIAFLAAAPFFLAVMVRPSLGLATVWTGLVVWMCVRGLRNHRRVRGDAWMAGVATVG